MSGLDRELRNVFRGNSSHDALHVDGRPSTCGSGDTTELRESVRVGARGSASAKLGLAASATIMCFVERADYLAQRVRTRRLPLLAEQLGHVRARPAGRTASSRLRDELAAVASGHLPPRTGARRRVTLEPWPRDHRCQTQLSPDLPHDVEGWSGTVSRNSRVADMKGDMVVSRRYRLPHDRGGAAMFLLHRIVRTDADRAGWVVLDGTEQQVLTRTRTKREAVSAATQELLQASTEGRLQVHFADGRLESDQIIKASRERVGSTNNVPIAPGPLATARAIVREGKQVDKGLDALDVIATACGLIGLPIATLLHPRLQEVIGGGWIGLTLATFTWTVGCALAIAVVRKSGLAGYPLLGAVSICYVVALVVSAVIGRGVLEIDVVQTGLGPFNLLATVIASALVAYGPAGFVLCGGIGTWLGFRVSAHLEDGFLT